MTLVIDSPSGWPPVASDVHTVEFRNIALDQLDVDALARVWHAGGITALAFDHCVVSDRMLKLCAEQAIKAQPGGLSTLAITHCHPLSMTTLIGISSLLSSSLSSLDLSDCKLARQAGIILSQSLAQCTQLRQLRLARNHLRDGGIRSIIEALRGRSTPLHELDISQNGISSSAIAMLSDVRVRRVHACDNAITSCALFTLTRSNANLGAKVLEELDLSGNALSANCWRSIASFVCRERDDQVALRVLRLEDTSLTVQALDELSTAMRQSKTCWLNELYLGKESSWQQTTPEEKDQWWHAANSLLDSATELCPHLHIVLSRTEANDKAATKALGSDDGVPHTEQALGQANVGNNEELRQDMDTKADESSLTLSALRMDPQDTMRQIELNTKREVLERVVAPTSDNAARVRQVTQDTGGPSASALARASSRRQMIQSSLSHTDIEYIVSKTIECMNQNFEQRLAQFLSRMEQQQQDKHTSQVQMLAAKVDACERALPRIEARLDVLSDRVASANANFGKVQNEFQHFSTQMDRDLKAAQSTSKAMDARQVEECCARTMRQWEQAQQSELARLRREMNPQAVVDAVSMHLTQFKQEFDTNQSTVLQSFTDDIVKDGQQLEDRVNELETKLSNLESVVQAEQQASLLALEAISDAFSGSTSTPVSKR